MKKLLSLVLLSSLALVACGANSKQVAVLANRAAGQQVWNIQDTERRICNQAAFDADPTEPILECAGPMAQASGLTTEKHREIAKHLSAVYAVRIRIDQALLTWQPGTPEPAGIDSMLTQANAALAVIRGLASTDEQRALVDAGEALVDEIRKIIAAFRQ